MGCGSSSSNPGKPYAPGPPQQAPQTGFQPILDSFESIQEVQASLQKRGLETSDILLFVDFTKSNEWTGKTTFQGRCLHDVTGGTPNPYAQVISIMCKTLAPFDDDKLIPTFGFGDHLTKSKALFSFQPGGQPVHTFERVLQLYPGIAHAARLSGPTSFAPAIHKAIDQVIRTGHEYQIAIIIADGQVTQGCMRDTVDAIVLASQYCLSIILVGVGDGPWDEMKAFDDQLPHRKFDNFQFVDFAQTMSQSARGGFTPEKAEAMFALAALMEIPDQYAEIKKHRLMGPQSRPAPPPQQIPIMDPPGSATGGQPGAERPSNAANPDRASAPGYPFMGSDVLSQGLTQPIIGHPNV